LRTASLAFDIGFPPRNNLTASDFYGIWYASEEIVKPSYCSETLKNTAT
jgi:hypothetical protein